MTVDYNALAKAHMSQQVRDVTVIQALLGRLWDKTIDPFNLEATFVLFTEQAVPIINAGRLRGELTAQQYYAALRAVSGYSSLAPEIARQLAESSATRASLRATGLVVARKSIESGQSPRAAMTLARAAMLRSAKRRTLQAGRQRLIALSQEDDDARGWARVADADPCYFCAMLVSRGPVYSEATVAFQAHDGCGCSVRPAFKNDPDRGWSPEARQLRELWDSQTVLDWRKTYTEAMADPTSKTFLTVTPRGAQALAA